MPNILFVCSANRFRSVLAAGYFKALLLNKQPAGEWIIGSAGIWASEGIPPIKEAIEIASLRQVKVDEVRSREITRELIERADLIIVMTDGQREGITLEFPQARNKTHLFSEITVDESFDIPDPMTTIGEDPKVIAEEIFSMIETGYDRIITRATSGNSTNISDN